MVIVGLGVRCGVELSFGLGQSAVAEPVGLQLKLLERQFLLLDHYFGVVLRIVDRVLRLFFVQHYDARATRWIKRLNNLQTLLIIVQKRLRCLAPQPTVVLPLAIVFVF